MKPSLFIAWRYFFSKKKQTAVNLISSISLAGIALGTAALLVVLSVFSGFTNLIAGLYGSLDPDIKIEAIEGKYFNADSLDINFDALPGLLSINQVREEKALIRYNDKEYIVSLLAIDSSFFSQAKADGILIEGDFPSRKNEVIMGQGVAYFLSFGLSRGFRKSVNLFLPKNKQGLSVNLTDAFYQSPVVPTGIFSSQAEYDSKYVIIALEDLQDLLLGDGKLTSLALNFTSTETAEEAKLWLTEQLPDGLIAKDRIEQHAFMHQVMQAEKWAIFLIFTFILIIAAFNLIGSISMLILDKMKEVNTLWQIGASDKQLTNIFFYEGLFISGFGALAGLILGILLSLGQQEFGWLKMGSGNFVVESYPVALEMKNILLVALTVACIGLLSAAIPALRLNKVLKRRA